MDDRWIIEMLTGSGKWTCSHWSLSPEGARGTFTVTQGLELMANMTKHIIYKNITLRIRNIETGEIIPGAVF